MILTELIDTKIGHSTVEILEQRSKMFTTDGKNFVHNTLQP